MACKWKSTDWAFESETAVSKEEKQREATISARLLCVPEGCKQWKCNYNMGWSLMCLVWSVLSWGQTDERLSPLSFTPLLVVKRSWAKPKLLVRIQEMIWLILGGPSCQSWFLQCNEDQILVLSLLTSDSCLNPAHHALLLAVSVTIVNIQPQFMISRFHLKPHCDAVGQARSKILLRVVFQFWKDSSFD